ncbi:hypothetical phage protein [Erwinia phage phiEa21-4]|uniref:Hypothetical phage protein n=1 Tax=Erwinia phage phiEa21-4 TaxID=557393 RepID=B8QTT0_9CAUD|nr:hypothetical protein Ea21-4_gp32 [Erwinia phage phiEa21-4]ACH88945.1 hypothetical phage protein [Erwinia phage phiEa21-4]
MLRRRLRLILRHFSALLRGLLSEDKQTYSLPREARTEAYEWLLTNPYRRLVGDMLRGVLRGRLRKGLRNFLEK